MKRSPYCAANFEDPVEYLARPAYSGSVQSLSNSVLQNRCRSFSLVVEVELAGQKLVISVKGEGI